MRRELESLVNKMLDGRILLDEAISEFEKLYIQAALKRTDGHLTNTATMLGIHRNTLSKRVNGYKPPKKVASRKLVRRKAKAAGGRS